MNISLEIKLIKTFVKKEKQDRYIQFVSSETRRGSFISELSHFNDFKWEKFDEVRKDEAQEIEKRLKALNIKSNKCYVISEEEEIDKKIFDFKEVIQIISLPPSILVFEDAKLIYYEGEPPYNRYISKVK